MATIATIRDRIAAQQTLFFTENNGGAGKVYRLIPRQIPNANLPAWMTATTDATYQRNIRGAESAQETRDFLMRFFSGNYALGEEGKTEADAEAWIEPIQTFWGKRPRMELAAANTALNDIEQSYLTGDAGIRPVPYPTSGSDNATFCVIEFRLRTIFERQISYL